MLIWIKRILPLVLIVVAYYGYSHFSEQEQQERAAEIDSFALVTAQVWLGSAEMRNSPERFIAWRDSLLQENGLSLNQMDLFLSKYSDATADNMKFVRAVKKYVDSLYQEGGTEPSNDSTGGRGVSVSVN